jgi:hypothetical protein
MYASFLNLPAAGRDSRASHLELFTVPSTLATFNEVITPSFARNRWITPPVDALLSL